MWFAMMVWQLQGFGFDNTISMRAFRRFQLGLPMPNCGIYTLTSQGKDAWAVKFQEDIYKALVQRLGFAPGAGAAEVLLAHPDGPPN